MAKWINRRSKALGTKTAKHLKEKQKKAIMRYERKTAYRKQINKLGMKEMAGGLVEKYELYTRPMGKKILRLLLQRLVLEKFSTRMGKKLNAERECIAIANSAWVIQKILIENKYGRLSVKNAQKMYESIAKIMEAGNSIFKSEKNGIDNYYKKEAKKARNNLAEITEKGEKEVLFNRARLCAAIETGEKCIQELSNQLPELTQTGFEVIEEIVDRKLGTMR